jgi:hypothetical protein
MLRYEVYIGKRLLASFINWADAEQFSRQMGTAIIIDCESNILYRMKGDTISSELLFLEPILS